MTTPVSSPAPAAIEDNDREHAGPAAANGDGGAAPAQWADVVNQLRRLGERAGNQANSGEDAGLGEKDAETAKAIADVCTKLGDSSSAMELDASARAALETVKKNGGNLAIENALAYILNPHLKASGDFNPQTALTNLTEAANTAGYNGKDAQSGQAVDDLGKLLTKGASRAEIETSAKAALDIIGRNGGGEKTAATINGILDPHLKQNGDFNPDAAAASLTRSADLDGLHGAKAQTSRFVADACEKVAGGATGKDLEQAVKAAAESIDKNGGFENSKTALKDILSSLENGSYNQRTSSASLTAAAKHDGVQIDEKPADGKPQESPKTGGFDEAAKTLLKNADYLPGTKDEKNTRIQVYGDHTETVVSRQNISNVEKMLSESGLSETEIQDTLRPMKAATILSNNWKEWGLDKGKIDFGDPSKSANWNDLPKEAQETLKYVSSNPNLMRALDAPEGKADNTITHDNVDTFIKANFEDVQAAKSALNDYNKKNPNADPSALSVAKSAAFLTANQTLIAASGPEMDPGKEGQRANHKGIHPSNLKAIEDDPSLPQSLRDAAALWRQPGMTALVDMSSKGDALDKPDKVIGRDDLTSWLKNTTLKKDSDTITLLGAAAERNAVADIDTSKLTGDVLKNPQKYDGATKAAVMMELSDLAMKISAGKDQKLFENYYAETRGFNPNSDFTLLGVSNEVAKLSADKDVQKYLADSRVTQLEKLANSNKSLKSSLENYAQNAMVNGKALDEAMSGTDTKGNKASVPDGIRQYMAQVQSVSAALGKSGNPPDLSKVAEKAGKTKEIKEYFDRELKSGQELRNNVKNGMPPSAAAERFSANAAAVQMVMGDSLTDGDIAEMKASYNDALTDTQLEKANPDDLLKVFGDGKGNLDDNKIRQVYEEAVKKNPELGTTEDGTPLPVEDVVKQYRNAFELARKGSTLTDALSKVSSNFPAGGPAYKSGIMHAVSALMLGGVTVPSSLDVSGSRETISTVGNYCAMASLVTGASTKYMKYTMTAEGDAAKQLERKLKIGDGAGKIIGGAGGILTSAVSFLNGIDDIRKGKNLSGAFSIASGALGTGSALCTIAEGALGAAAAAAGGTAAESMALLVSRLGVGAAGLGFAATSIGIIGAFALRISEGLKEMYSHRDFADAIAPTLKKYDLTKGATEPVQV